MFFKIHHHFVLIKGTTYCKIHSSSFLIYTVFSLINVGAEEISIVPLSNI
nr:MAG TPA: hypothetical protein [Crassvirales sp.]